METQASHVEVRKLLRKTTPLAITFVIASTLAGCKSSTDKVSKQDQKNASSRQIDKKEDSCGICPQDGKCIDGQCICAGSNYNGTSSNCTYIMKDPDNCGKYGNKCAKTEVCTDGECGCHTLMTECGEEFCAYTKRDPENCGSCGNKCPLGAECSEGSCVPCKSDREICDDIDNNCNREVDEGLTCECTHRSTKVCGTRIGECTQGIETCTEEGKWGPCEGDIGPIPEICDNDLDDDCDGKADSKDEKDCPKK